MYLQKYLNILLCIGCRQAEEGDENLHQEAIELPQEEDTVPAGVCETPPAGQQEDSVEVERVLPPTLSSTMLLVDEGEAQHLEKKRKLELTLLEKQIEAEERKIQAQEAKIEAEKRRSEAFIAMTNYYSK